MTKTSPPKKNLKQGNLFSFFAKKDNSTKSPKQQEKKVDDELGIPLGTKLSVLWPDDDEYYTCKVEGKRGNMYTILYDDGDVETVDLRNETYKVLSCVKEAPASSITKKSSSPGKIIGTKKRTPVTFQTRTSLKKRRVLQDTDDELDDTNQDGESEDDDGSVFIGPEEESDDDDDDISMMVTDEEDCVSKPKKNRPKPRLNANAKPINKTSPVNKKDNTDFSQYKISPILTPPPIATCSDDSNQEPMPIRQVTPPLPPISSSVKQKLLRNLDPKAVNPAGSHYHNHYPFLFPENIRDANNFSKSDPGYNPRTLKVELAQIERVTKSKISPAQRQWWDIKSQYFDTVLLFKTGKFYEMFHMDADIGVSHLNLVYMKGAAAHAGFPEVGYASFSEKLVQAGFKVARVEQTETPDALKARRKRVKGTPNVVAREVCSIISAGTRTFCFLDNRKVLDDVKDDTNVGPLLAIKEVKLSPKDENPDAVWEYGVTVVNAITGTLTVGQFADDILKSRMKTLLTTFGPSEVLIEESASPELTCLLRSQHPPCRVEKVLYNESFPKSTAVDPEIRQRMGRQTSGKYVHPWDVQETMQELHHQGYFPRASRKSNSLTTSRWPVVLQACVEGEATLCLASFGATLFYLQRSLIDYEILSMGSVQAYCPPTMTSADSKEEQKLQDMVREQTRVQDCLFLENLQNEKKVEDLESKIDHMALDGTTLANLEILTNLQTNTSLGSLWAKLNHTRTPHGSRLLRAWLLRPLFRVNDINRRADAVSELTFGPGASAISEARQSVLKKCGDTERLLSRIHSMSGSPSTSNGENQNQDHHPKERAVLYEMAIYTKRQVGDFSKLLQGLRAACLIPELFSEVPLQPDGLLHKIVNLPANGGCFPDMEEHLNWFLDNFNCDLAANGQFEPAYGMDARYDEACNDVKRIKTQLEEYKEEMCTHELRPSSLAKKSWKYANTKVDSKDKYLIELPINVQVPSDFYVKGKRGSGAKQINKYRTPIVEKLVHDLEHAQDIIKECKSRGIQLIFSKFDSLRPLWTAASQATAMLDALGSLAEVSSQAGFIRPQILDCSAGASPEIDIVQGKHPCVGVTHSGIDFVPNNLKLGGKHETSSVDCARAMLLSGPNMGGKSTLLRQTCLITILAQIGCFVPAEKCSLTPIDRIFTRLGASDRILLGQSTFFVELAETAAALRGAGRRSLVIMDELGRGTSTFDGTAIASATLKYLVERNKCITMFATHYHSLLEDWKDQPKVRFGHMECLVEYEGVSTADTKERNSQQDSKSKNITFLYTLGEGSCPKSFGINVARLAGLPQEVITMANEVSTHFEAQMTGTKEKDVTTLKNALSLKQKIVHAMSDENWDEVEEIWSNLRTSLS